MKVWAFLLDDLAEGEAGLHFFALVVVGNLRSAQPVSICFLRTVGRGRGEVGSGKRGWGNGMEIMNIMDITMSLFLVATAKV